MPPNAVLAPLENARKYIQDAALRMSSVDLLPSKSQGQQEPFQDSNDLPHKHRWVLAAITMQVKSEDNRDKCLVHGSIDFGLVCGDWSGSNLVTCYVAHIYGGREEDSWLSGSVDGVVVHFGGAKAM